MNRNNVAALLCMMMSLRSSNAMSEIMSVDQLAARVEANEARLEDILESLQRDKARLAELKKYEEEMKEVQGHEQQIANLMTSGLFSEGRSINNLPQEAPKVAVQELSEEKAEDQNEKLSELNESQLMHAKTTGAPQAKLSRPLDGARDHDEQDLMKKKIGFSHADAVRFINSVYGNHKKE